MKANETPHEMSLQEKAICLALTGRKPELPYPLGEVECADGTVFTGCNVENAALGSTICAERNACCKAVSEGHQKFVRLAIYADSENWCTPCGACRQFLAEFTRDQDIEGLCAKAGNRYVSYKLSELLPHIFGY